MTPQVPTIFDETRRRARHGRAVNRQAQGGRAQWLIEAMAADLRERLAFMRFEGRRVLVSGLGGEAMGLAGRRQPLSRWDAPLEDGPWDLIVSLGELDTVNDLPGALIHLRRALAPGGLLLASMTGAGSLPGLRQALLVADGDRPAARIHPQIDSLAASALLQRAGFTRQVVDHYPLTVRYAALPTLLADLRDQGLSSVLADRAPALTRAGWARAEQAFGALADADGKVSERFEILTMTAWKD